MRSSLLFTSFAALATAAPASWSPELAAFYTESSKSILEARTLGLWAPPICDVSKVNITAYLATVPNAPPVKDPGNAKLVQVTVGRGIQNYTCADNNNSTAPKAIGAVANLYNVSCIAALHAPLLTIIPDLAVQYNTSLDQNGHLMAFNIQRTGHHFFNANGAPVFDLNDDKSNPLGVLVADGKNPDMKVAAPSSASKGQIRAANGQTGAVPWLKLNAQAGSTNGLTEVYRVVTAGGVAPASCAGQPALISVEYAAQYWFFTSL